MTGNQTAGVLAGCAVLWAVALAQTNAPPGSGTSGPGRPFTGYASGAAPPLVARGLLPPIRPLLDLHIRDTYITRGGDGNFYMTGSTGDRPQVFNDGVELWRSADLREWKYLGVVWSIDDDGTWQRAWRRIDVNRVIRAVRAPEIHYIRGNYVICLSMLPEGVAILRSRTGRPEGPYISTLDSDRPLTEGVDPTLFEDADGSVYFTYGAGSYVARMKDDLSALAEPYHRIELYDPDHNPAHHAGQCAARGMNDLGREGAVLFRANGKYYLGAADTYDGRYSTCLAVADKIYGPYRARHEPVPGNGGTGFFQDGSGGWWSAYFGDDAQAPFREKPGAVRVEFDANGLMRVAKNQPSWLTTGSK
jgi:xylan 1,4-beta-xylosidase